MTRDHKYQDFFHVIVEALLRQSLILSFALTQEGRSESWVKVNSPHLQPSSSSSLRAFVKAKTEHCEVAKATLAADERTMALMPATLGGSLEHGPGGRVADHQGGHRARFTGSGMSYAPDPMISMALV